MITCFIKYEIDPFKRQEFVQYAQNWGQLIPQCGADLIGYYAPYEGSTTTAYGLYNVKDLAAYQAYRQRLNNHPLGKQNYEFSQQHKFIKKEDRIFLTNASLPHVELIKP